MEGMGGLKGLSFGRWDMALVCGFLKEEQRSSWKKKRQN